MRCLSCDCELNDIEATRKYDHGEFIDLCSSCTGKAFFNEDVIPMEAVTEEVPYEDEVEHLGFGYENGC